MDENLPPLGTPPSPPPPPIYQAPPPPIMVVAPPAKPARTGRGWKVFSLLLLILLVLVLFSNFRNLAHGPGRAVQQGEQPLDEILIENNQSQNKIAIVEVDGIITSSAMDRSGRSMVDSIQHQLEAAGRDAKVRAVVLKVNSPGGEVLASDEIYNLIKDFQSDHDKPVIASMGTLAASGGYYVSAPCRWIVANEMTITGSIGVIMHGYNYRGLMDKIGLRPEVYKSGKFKNMLSGDRLPEEVPEEEHEMVQALIDEVYGKFTNIVAEGRQEASKQNKGVGRELVSDWTEFADGRVVSGKQALEIGLVDELGNLNIAIERAMSIAKIQNTDLIRYERRFNLGDFFGFLGETKKAPAIKVDLGLDFPQLQIGRLYFITPTTLP